jgi:cystathionine gamma-lyase
MAFASGMAAIGAIVQRLSAGDHVIYEENVYGGTHRFFDKVMRRLGIDFTAVDSSDPQRVEDAIRPNTRLIHLETPTNPMMKLTDLPAIADIADARGVHVVVDNTFASPYNQRPLELGAHMVVHSSTKYLNGHSDVVGGIVVTSDDGIAEELRFLQKAAGAVPGPWDSWLVLRGTKTLHVRMERTTATASASPSSWRSHDGVERVHYPGLPTHPQHELAKRQMRGFTGMISIELGSLERATRGRAGHAAVRAGGVAGRRRVADRASGHHDARVGAEGDARPHGRHRWAGPAVRRHRGRRRPARGPRDRRCAA